MLEAEDHFHPGQVHPQVAGEVQDELQALQVVVAVGFPLGEVGREVGVEFSVADAQARMAGMARFVAIQPREAASASRKEAITVMPSSIVGWSAGPDMASAISVSAITTSRMVATRQSAARASPPFRRNQRP